MKLEFKIRCDATLHGFAGYFHSNLFGEHAISINPATFSEGMFSWFPIYFPIRNPMYVRKVKLCKLRGDVCPRRRFGVVLVFGHSKDFFFLHEYNKFTGTSGCFYIDGQDTDSQSARSVVLDWIVRVILIYIMNHHFFCYNAIGTIGSHRPIPKHENSTKISRIVTVMIIMCTCTVHSQITTIPQGVRKR